MGRFLMKICCQNFGPLREFSIDLDADFVLIVGENNIGKSYAISLLYAILKSLTTSELVDRPYLSEFFLEKIGEKTSESLKDDFLRLYKVPSTKNIDITELVRSSAMHIVHLLFIEPLEKSIEGTFGEISNLENRRNSDATTISIKTDVLSIDMKISNGRLFVSNISMLSVIVYRKSKQHRAPKVELNKTVIYGPADVPEQAIIRVAFTGYRIFSEFVQEVMSTIGDIHYLPASRSGLYQALSAFGQIIAELSKRRTFLSQRIELPAISEPLVDYFLKLNEIKPTRRNMESPFSLVADSLEKTVLGGTVEFDPKTKRLFYKPFDVDLKLDLSSTSSMVSEVAPIVTYLKHVLPESESRRGSRRLTRVRQIDGVRRKQIIFIEEPEAHLHPRSQVLLMDAFASLVRDAGVKLVMTSHSNFIFNKTSNLVIAGAFGASNIEAFRFVREEKGTASYSLEVDELGITDENFGDVSEELFSEKLDLIDLLESRPGDLT